MYISTCTELFTLNQKFVGYELSFGEKSVTFSTTEKAVSQLDLVSTMAVYSDIPQSVVEPCL